jgi:hypothetical protein
MKIKHVRASQGREDFVSALRHFARADNDYWSYKRMGDRPGLHGLIRYPAMMVPQMQADVLQAAASVFPRLKHVADPFVGSGTTMLEALRLGLSFDGYDINPLAILICRAKLLPLSPVTVRRRTLELLNGLAADRATHVDVDFPGRDKWFTRTASADLSRIRRAIMSQSSRELRRFFWVIMAETIRRTSLSRESTYKLHVRPVEEHGLVERPKDCFERLAKQAIERHAQHCDEGRRYKEWAQQASLTCADIRTVDSLRSRSAQLLITSPPYGDNESTIPYGQFSYLALRWIAAEDLDGRPDLRETAYAIDTASLGGSRRGYVERAVAMAAASPTFKRFFERLAVQRRPDLEAKAACFTSDLFDAIGAALSKLEEGGLAVWTLGERRIGGLAVPLVQICSELNQFFGMTPLTEISRSIHSKRMPHRNSEGVTMARETMLVMQKA